MEGEEEETGEDVRWRVVKTNSGEGSKERCDRKRDFQGAGAAERWWVVVDIVRREGVSRRRRRREDSEAILEEEKLRQCRRK